MWKLVNGFMEVCDGLCMLTITLRKWLNVEHVRDILEMDSCLGMFFKVEVVVESLA